MDEFAKTILTVFIALFVLYIIFSIVFPILQYKSWYNWYNTYDPDKKYRCISMVSLAYFQYNNILYRIYNTFSGNTGKFQYDFWVYFISAILLGEAHGVVPNGLCTPKTLCESLIPPGLAPSPFPDGTRVWPTTGSDWKKLILSWTGMTTIPSNEDDWKPNADTWTNDPNNFLYKWGITANSPMIYAFVTGLDIYKSDPVYPFILEPLLGIKRGLLSGGWYGLLQRGDNFGGNGLSAVNRMVWGSEPIPSNISKHQSGTAGKCNAASVAQGAFGMGMGGAFAGAAIGSAVPVIGTVVGAVIGGILGGTGGGVLSAASQKCL